MPVWFGELLSEEAEVSLETAGFGSLLAATNNDAYNALVCAHFAPEMGRQRVYQLAAEEVPEARRPAPAARGLIAFGAGVRFDDLERQWYQGSVFRTTRITEERGAEDFIAGLPEGATPLVVIGSKGGVRPVGEDGALRSRPGERVVWFGSRDLSAARPGSERAQGADPSGP